METPKRINYLDVPITVAGDAENNTRLSPATHYIFFYELLNLAAAVSAVDLDSEVKDTILREIAMACKRILSAGVPNFFEGNNDPHMACQAFIKAEIMKDCPQALEYFLDFAKPFNPRKVYKIR